MATMRAMTLTGHGGTEKLVWRTDWPMPVPGNGEALVKMAASSVNNTDINTRVGWYAQGDSDDGSWTGQGLGFPIIQGTDIAGTIVAVGAGVDPARIGERVIVQSCLTSLGKGKLSPFVGSEVPGGFADFAAVPAADCFTITADIPFEELGALPCAYGTAANMLEQAGVKQGDRVLVTGASGNVGIAAVKLAKLAGAHVTAAASPGKHRAMLDLGADACVFSDLFDLAGKTELFDVVIDLVGGEHWGRLFELMAPFGRLSISGAVGGAFPVVDLRLIYLKNLRIIGCTEQSRESFAALVGQINSGAIRPLVHAVLPLSRLVDAQEMFLARQHVGKIVIVPDPNG